MKHIIPKCLGGQGTVLNVTHPNIVLLTAKEHYMAHRLLCEIYPDNKKLRYALWMMIKVDRYDKRYVPSGKVIARIKESRHKRLIALEEHAKKQKLKLRLEREELKILEKQQKLKLRLERKELKILEKKSKLLSKEQKSHNIREGAIKFKGKVSTYYVTC